MPADSVRFQEQLQMNEELDLNTEYDSKTDSDWCISKEQKKMRQTRRSKRRRCRTQGTSSLPRRTQITSTNRPADSEACIFSEGKWFTPSQFEEFGGKGKSKKWKTRIFYHEVPLKILIQGGFLPPTSFIRCRKEEGRRKIEDVQVSAAESSRGARRIIGIEWFGRFLARQHLSVRTPEATSLGSATAFNKTTVREFFKNLAVIMDRHAFPPNIIYNVDETGVFTVQKPRQVVTEKGKSKLVLSHHLREENW
ncbi:uncharacterized protein LOC143517561 [Brachyhypopomus gauderio]|uniref:uncharacterized protein LOC143517561 n=1 Tax=Brachyhypopomus gauderio TaxID=698409 RepID=UPI004041CB0F